MEFNDPRFTPTPGKEFPRGSELTLRYPIGYPITATLKQSLAVVITSQDEESIKLISTESLPDVNLAIPPLQMSQMIDLIDVTTNTPLNAQMSLQQIFVAITSLARFMQINSGSN